jgi:Protein of unknown function DUF86
MLFMARADGQRWRYHRRFHFQDSTLRQWNPEISWDDIAAFRNRIVHGYLGVSLDIVWDIIQRDLPPLANLAREGINLRSDHHVRSDGLRGSEALRRAHSFRYRWRTASLALVGWMLVKAGRLSM